MGLVLSIVLLAGCSGVIPGDNTGPASGDGTDAGTPTPGQAQATPTPTPTPTVTPTPTPTPTPTATPVPGYLDYNRYGDEIAEELNNYRGEKPWADGFGNHSRDGVGVVISKPEGWTVQDAEMEGAREVARLSDMLGRSTVQEAKEDDVWLRPKTFQVLVFAQDGQFLSRVTIDGETAAAYADNETTLKKYANHVADSREVPKDVSPNVTISERKPTLALRAAEYRPFMKIHLHRINTSHPFNLSEDEGVPEIEKSVIVPDEHTIYYEHTHKKGENGPAKQSQVTRTYLETIKQVRETSRVNRLPAKMVLYQDYSAYEYDSALTTAWTAWAFDYFRLSNWTLPQNKTVTPQELDAYHNRIEINTKFIKDDENYDPLNETVRSED